jgi:hypothetical protein
MSQVWYNNIWALLIVNNSSERPITVAERSKAWIVVARSNDVIMGSNPTQGVDVCIACIYSVFVLFYV